MKKRTLLLLSQFLLLVAFSGCWQAGEEEYYNEHSYTSQANYDEYNVNDLNPYGQWITTPEYGRVWRPNVQYNWQPFTDGHWVYDGNDWVWVSYEPYGGIVYHYGNWEYYGASGWVWIPNRAHWSPACVQWVYYGDVVAWAPRPLHRNAWGNPWDQREHPAWVAVRSNDFNADHVLPRRMPTVVRNENQYRDDQIIRKQPDVKYVETHTGKSIPVVTDPGKLGRNPATGTPVKIQDRIDDKPQTPAGNTGVPGRVPTKTPTVIDERPHGYQQPTEVGRPAPTQPNGNNAPTVTTPAKPTPDVPGRIDAKPQNGGQRQVPVSRPVPQSGTTIKENPATPNTPAPPTVKTRPGRPLKNPAVNTDQSGSNGNKPVHPSKTVDDAKQRIEKETPKAGRPLKQDKPAERKVQPPAEKEPEKKREEAK